MMQRYGGGPARSAVWAPGKATAVSRGAAEGRTPRAPLPGGQRRFWLQNRLVAVACQN